ncbi:uncharacterized protein LOC127449294 [Myxocyprinus asiaticus]|uniref:uncharacterized protein LOC127449294 n=1 Tax=Myxocyprinus asiaticus TaxID=70543 RepID=UPI00222369BA|nr:uncharacterized protein LOC127449294 [Myxocyprinus asiaticus]XP_051568595.1 uncharacterized protein LOC127449294 [Myxocyprinus asiaticus]
MDDFDHSMLIAEQDWDCFCTVSEECSVQQAKLAVLDDSGLSDNDDDKTSIHVSSPSTKASSEPLYKKDSSAEGQTQCKTQEIGQLENSEFTECNAKTAGQACDIRLNDQGASYECLELDHNKTNEDSNSSDQTDLDVGILRGNGESQGENRSSQAIIKLVSEMSSPFTQDIGHGNSTDGTETGTEVTDSSSVPTKEKERWFVTVNDSPVRLREKAGTSGQKKRRKKKSSKNVSQHSGVIIENHASLNNNTEADIKIIERQTIQVKFEQPPKCASEENNAHNENSSSHLPNIHDVLHNQDIKCESPAGSSDDEWENISYAIHLKKESTTDIPEAKLESNPPSINSSSLLTPKQIPQSVFKNVDGPLPQIWNHERTAFNYECQPTIDHLSHFNDTGEGSPRFILGASTPTAPSDTEEERKELQELFRQSMDNVKESLTPQEIHCLQSSSNSAKTLEAAVGPTRPIYAISSFWDEMEKFTINDILQLRTGNNSSPLRESIIQGECSPIETADAHLQDRGEVDSKDESVEDSGLVDDAADSDYFTHVDDSRPDRSSCEFSTFSDFDEEFLNLFHTSANPSPEPLDSQEQTQNFLGSTSGKDLLQEGPEQTKSSYQSESEEIASLCPPESELQPYMYSEAQMQEMLLTTSDQDNTMSTFLLDHCNMRRSTPSPVLSISDILEDQCLLSLFEILRNDTQLEQRQERSPGRSTSVVSLPFAQNLSVPETYDYLLSDFEVDVLFTSEQSTTKSEKKMVPIYSSSHSVVRDLVFPEVEEVKHSDSEKKSAQIRNQQTRYASPSGTPNLCYITSHSNQRTWRNLSLRRIKLSFMEKTWCRMATSCVFPKTTTADKAITANCGTRITSNSSVAHSNFPMLLLENQALGRLTDQQIHVGATLSGPDRDCFFFSLKQADMCLVCIAFASWVLKSTNLQSADMWKAALLANVSAISAIQYLRRYVKEVTEDEP